MREPVTTQADREALRRALRLGIANGVLWAVGNSLTTGPLVTYLAIAVGAKGLGVALLLALPALVGLLRVFAPWTIRRYGGLKPAACKLFAYSYLLILLLPAVTVTDVFPNAARPLLLVALVCVHQLLEYFGTVALWAWLGDLTPRRLRGRYLGRRQFWQLAAQIPVLVLAGAFSWYWRDATKGSSGFWPLLGYSIPILAGGVCLLASIVPLIRMPAPTLESHTSSRAISGELLAPLRNQRSTRLLIYGCWLAFFNGLAQTPQSFFTNKQLGIEAGALLILQTVMRFGQMAMSRPSGALADRIGNRPVMLVSQAIVATGPLFFLLATLERPWWIAGAWIVWSAFAGLNICLPNLNMKFSTPQTRPATFALYYALTSVAYASSTLIGGQLYDLLKYESFYVGTWYFDVYGFSFYVAFVTRMLGLVFILAIDEPGSWKFSTMVARLRHSEQIGEIVKRHPLDRDA